ncbi:hypothetical protein Misp01_14100 [Microtetraspora sp. NBRC 13810]|uniref:trypsin-like serine peptidase n=1 Tax=Microtetraspora sp. NBRC 13810 TaxID=3030990 RepID=UPI0024A36D8C|nr:hypothetical protein [Microtetraspora sp. NBRC 13810]GLW06280.1 hypothetical protein Misp01_14100 [Microtetraspora sp. NBRC 13810]
MNTRAKRLILPVGGALLASTVVGVSMSATAQAAPDRKSATLAASTDAKAIAGNWNAKKLQSAKSYLEDSTAAGRLKSSATKAAADGKAGSIAPSGQTSRTAGKSKNVNLPTTVGKVFFEVDGKPYWCSGSAIQSKYHNLVATAGHCVYDTDKNKPVQNFVFIPGYYQGKAPWGIYVGAKVHTHYDFDVYEDYDKDYAFVNVYNGIKQTGEKEVVKSEYEKHKGFKYTVDKAISQKEYEEGVDKYGVNGPYWKRLSDPTVETVGKPADAEKYLEDYIKDGRNGVKLAAVEVTEATYAKAPKGLENNAQYERKTVKLPISQEEYKSLLVQKGDGKFLGKLEADKDKNGNEIAWFKTQYFVKKWVKTTVKELYFRSHYYVKTFTDAGRLGDNVAEQGFAWNQKLYQKAYAFGYPTAPHLDGNKPYSGQTMKWCYNKMYPAPAVSSYKVQEQVALKCAFTPGASGGPLLLQYKNAKRTGYINGVVSLTLDTDGNRRYDRITTPYFDGETYGIYKYAANLWTGKLGS